MSYDSLFGRLINNGNLLFLALVPTIIKSVGICTCHHPTNRGFSHCPVKVGRQRRSPRLYMQTTHSALSLTGYQAECKILHTTGICRCCTLDFNMIFCENFDLSRISADKRFYLICSLPPSSLAPDRGFCESVCVCKGINKNPVQQRLTLFFLYRTDIILPSLHQKRG